jgi:hypothetical protein
MPKIASKPESKSSERLAFEYYLRTGRRLTISKQVEQKFNPYHDGAVRRELR